MMESLLDFLFITEIQGLLCEDCSNNIFYSMSKNVYYIPDDRINVLCQVIE